MAKRLVIINYLKGYSIFTIVLYHLISVFEFYDWKPLIKLASNFGGAGVHIFILCSGFGLYLSHVNKPVSYCIFLKKRFLKVYIPYIIVIAISALIPMLYSGNRLIAFLSHVFLFKMFIPSYEVSFGTQFWFISTIIQFYLVFYVLLLLKTRLGTKKYALTSIVISLLYAILIGVSGKSNVRIWNSFFLQYLWEFSLGMILGEQFLNNNTLMSKTYKKGTLLTIAIVGIIITGILGHLGGAYKLFNDPFSLMGYGGLSLFVYSLNIKYIRRFFEWICTFSYEWYLLHILIFKSGERILNRFTPSFFIFLAIFVISIIIAIFYNQICHKLIYNRLR
jgi:peptidoglycan/LPS O-acetylase OafA/YrhL